MWNCWASFGYIDILSLSNNLWKVTIPRVHASGWVGLVAASSRRQLVAFHPVKDHPVPYRSMAADILHKYLWQSNQNLTSRKSLVPQNGCVLVPVRNWGISSFLRFMPEHVSHNFPISPKQHDLFYCFRAFFKTRRTLRRWTKQDLPPIEHLLAISHKTRPNEYTSARLKLSKWFMFIVPSKTYK